MLLLPQAHDCRNAGTITVPTAENTLTYAHKTVAHSPFCLGSLTFATPQAGGFMELILLHLKAIVHYSLIARSLD
jgi:hypothetical protein